jgi:hypothetical protein
LLSVDAIYERFLDYKAKVDEDSASSRTPPPTKFYMAKMDISKAYDTIIQEKLFYEVVHGVFKGLDKQDYVTGKCFSTSFNNGALCTRRKSFVRSGDENVQFPQVAEDIAESIRNHLLAESVRLQPITMLFARCSRD